MIVIIEPVVFARCGGDAVETTGGIVSPFIPHVLGIGGTCETSLPTVIARNPGAQLTP